MNRRHFPSRSARLRRSRGASLVVLVLWTTALLFGALALAKSIVTSAQVQKTNEETALACEAATRQIETLKAGVYSEVFVRFNAVTSDDPGMGASPGRSFVVPGLQAVNGDADGQAGEIVFPVSLLNGARLSETASGFPGFPRDLNLDGDAADASLTTSRILPVIVRIQWRSSGGGTRTSEIATTLGEP